MGTDLRSVLKSVRWLRVLLYALALSAMTLNVIGGVVARRVLLLSGRRGHMVPSHMVSGHSAAKPRASKPIASTSASLAVQLPPLAVGREKTPTKGDLESRLAVEQRTVDEPANGAAAGSGSRKRKKGKFTAITEPFPCAAENYVHAVYAADSKEYIAMVTSANSALHNSENPERLRFHMIYPAENNPFDLCVLLKQYILAYPGIQCTLDEEGLPDSVSRHLCDKGTAKDSSCFCASPQFHLLPFRASDYDVLTHTTSTHMDRKELLMGVNFARNFMDDLLLPWGVQRAIYMDVDTIVQGDLVNLWKTDLQGGKFFAAVSSCYLHMTFWFDFKVDIVKNTFSKNDCYINAGVYIVDLQQYKEDQVQKRIESLIRQHQKSKIWKLGVHQSSFILALANHTQTLDARWNFVQLGWNRALQPDKLKAAYILHWNGEKKPWKKDGLYIERWKPYAIDSAIN